jgi:hypothetical protein
LHESEKEIPQAGRGANRHAQESACHSTSLRKGYDAAGNIHKTTISEINVACEACHGPGLRHVEWAKEARAPYTSQSDKGLVILSSRWNEVWKLPAAGARTAQRDRPAADALTLWNVERGDARNSLIKCGFP